MLLDATRYFDVIKEAGKIDLLSSSDVVSTDGGVVVGICNAVPFGIIVTGDGAFESMGEGTVMGDEALASGAIFKEDEPTGAVVADTPNEAGLVDIAVASADERISDRGLGPRLAP